jgi:hypothetical protein
MAFRIAIYKSNFLRSTIALATIDSPSQLLCVLNFETQDHGSLEDGSFTYGPWRKRSRSRSHGLQDEREYLSYLQCPDLRCDPVPPLTALHLYISMSANTCSTDALQLAHGRPLHHFPPMAHLRHALPHLLPPCHRRHLRRLRSTP